MKLPAPSPLDIMNCLQDRPVVAGKAIPEKCVAAPSQEPHNGHPMRHWDRTCPACLHESLADQAEQIAEQAAEIAEWQSLNQHLGKQIIKLEKENAALKDVMSDEAIYKAAEEEMSLSTFFKLDEEALAVLKEVATPPIEVYKDGERTIGYQHQAEHMGTHADGCHGWGERHYECAMVEIARLRQTLEYLRGHELWVNAHAKAVILAALEDKK